MSDSAPHHGSAFAHQGVGCLILGPSGSGKSRITAEAITLGAKLVGDDRIRLEPLMGMVAAAGVPELAGVIELRGLGLIRMNDVATKHVLHLVIELDPAQEERLPHLETRAFLGVDIPFMRLAPSPKTTAAMILLYLKAMQEGRVLPADWKPNAA